MNARSTATPDTTISAASLQKQKRGLCGLHALNNALGDDIFGEEDLVYAVNQFLLENPELEDSIEDHMSDNGWFSSEVLSTALLTKAMAEHDQVTWRLDLKPLTTPEDLTNYVGALQNQNNQHWIAYRTINGHYTKLDAHKSRPTIISRSTFLEELRDHPRTYGIAKN